MTAVLFGFQNDTVRSGFARGRVADGDDRTQSRRERPGRITADQGLEKGELITASRFVVDDDRRLNGRAVRPGGCATVRTGGNEKNER